MGKDYTPAKKAYMDEYDRKNTVQKKMKLNVVTDADVLRKLDSVPNMQGYLKELIREDIARNGY